MADRAAEESGRGRDAERPRQIPKPGWRDVLIRTWKEMGRDHVTMVAAGVAFFGLLALFPAIAAIISLWGLMFDPAAIERQIEQVSAALPEQAAAIVREQARSVAAGAGGVGLAAIAGLALTLYSATKGVKSLIEGLNIVYDEEESRGFVRVNLVALLLTLVLIAMMLAALGLIVVLPALLGVVGLGGTAETLIALLRWPLLALVAMLALAMLYRFAPSRATPRWRWISWGAVIATALWVAGSIAFSLYVQNFGSYNETYGSIGAVIVLLMWFWLSAYIVLMGAELNSEIEHQTERDSTTGAWKPMGERGARVADTVGRAQ